MNEAKPLVRSESALPWRWLLPTISVALFCVVLWAAHRELNDYHWHDVLRQMRAINREQLAFAALLTATSYWLLTGFDVLGLRYARRKVSYGRTAMVSFMSYAFGHNIGLASLTGAALRYRLYSTFGLNVVDVATVVGFCSLTTMLGIAIVGGAALLFEPSMAVSALHLQQDLIQAIGVVALFAVLVYFSWATNARRTLTIRDWSLQPPRLKIAAPQLLLAIMDMIAASGALWFLLPEASRPSLLAFSGSYAVAVLAGLISNIPAGLGVFEVVLLTMLPNVPRDQLLGSLLIYRVIYYLAPLGLATLLFALVELSRQHVTLGKVNILASAYVRPVAPQLAGVLIFLSGTVLLISGATAAVDARIRLLYNLIPLPVLELSHLTGSVVGLGLIVIARGLFRRLRIAYHVTLWLLIAGIVASLLKGLDFEEAAILGLVLLVVYLGRAAFYRPATLSSQRFSPPWIASILIVFGVTAWFSVFAHRHIEYSNDLWWNFAAQANIPRSLRALLVTGVIATTIILLNWFAPAPAKKVTTSTDDLQKAKAILPTYADSSANAVLTGDKRLLFHEQGDAFIMYQIANHSWIALGDPVGTAARQEELIWQYRELCDLHGGRTVFYQVTPTRLSLYVDLGLSLIKLGEEARVPLKYFSIEGSARADLRQARRRAERDNARFEIIAPGQVADLLPQLQAISDSWLNEKAIQEKGFSLGWFDAHYLQQCPMAIVRCDDAVVAFANLWTSEQREELSVDLMRFGPGAPRGAMDYLFIELMLWGRAQEYRWFNLGMAPLSGLETHSLAPAWNRVGNFVFKHAEQFYNFEGLRRYKEKFQPEWRARYMAFPGGLALPRVLLDLSSLISANPLEKSNR